MLWHADPRGNCNRQVVWEEASGWPLVIYSVSLGRAKHLNRDVRGRRKNTELESIR